MINLIVVRAIWDEDASVWVATSEDLPGLVTEAESIEALRAKLPGMARDLLAFDHDQGDAVEVPLELIATAHQRVRLGAP